MSDLLPFSLIAPVVALIECGSYWLYPRARREVALRGVLMVSVAITGIEALLATFPAVVLILFSAFGGVEAFQAAALMTVRSARATSSART